MDIQNPFFQMPVPQDFPGELDEIQCPQPFDVGLRLNVVDHHLADDLKVAKVLPGKQEGRLREWYEFGGDSERPAGRSVPRYSCGST
jgi:hypothetical protein